MLGAGAFGGALGLVLEENRHTIQYFDPYKYPDITLSQALTFAGEAEGANADNVAQAEVIIVAVPSSVAPELLLELPKNIPIINASKGFISLKPFERFEDFSMISGPAFAKELLEKKPVTLTATSSLVVELFTTSWLSFDRTEDKLGVLLCGTLKNIYAIGAGYYAVKSSGNPTYYINNALVELKSILAANGANSETAELACGIGDLTLTCSSTQSRNYQFGQGLANKTPDDALPATIEGLSALELIKHTPDFIIPDTCTIVKNIQELVYGDPT